MTSAADQTWQRDHRDLLERCSAHSLAWLDSLADRPVGAVLDPQTLTAAFDEELPDSSTLPSQVLDLLVERAEPGLTAFGSGRFFSFVIGGSHPAGLGADLLTTVWDQNAGLRTVTPAAAAVEATASRWLTDVLQLPRSATVGFVTGGNMASFTCLAAGRHHILQQSGWNVEDHGLQRAPKVRVIASRERHATIDTSLRYLGLGAGETTLVEADSQGRMVAASLEQALSAGEGPTMVCLAAGNVNTGAFDDFARLIPMCHEYNAWVHVDGAFGLWAAASPTTRHLTAGVEKADSWSTDAHKWLNVPYDSGLAIVAHSASHRAAFQVGASYLLQDALTPDPMDLVPEFSRRARGFAVWAVMRSLGRNGITELGDRMCGLARHMAGQLAGIAGCEVVNEVVLNQVLVRFDDDDATTHAVVTRVIDSGTAYVGPSVFGGRGCMRISVCNGWTTEEDIEVSSRAIESALAWARHRSEEGEL